MTNHWLELAKKRLQEEAAEEPGIGFERLVESGIINESGEVTGKLRRWDAFLAIVEVKRVPGSPVVQLFRCLKPVFGMPGGATIDISRNSLLEYLEQGKKVITAHLDKRLKMWKQGGEIHLSAGGFIRADTGDGADDVGTLPEFHQTTSRL